MCAENTWCVQRKPAGRDWTKYLVHSIKITIDNIVLHAYEKESNEIRFRIIVFLSVNLFKKHIFVGMY